MSNTNDPRATHDHVGMMKQPRFWPAWPLLPLKNATAPREPGKFPPLAVLVEAGLAEDNETPDIRFIEGGNLFMGITAEQVANAPKADPDKLFREGWRVD